MQKTSLINFKNDLLGGVTAGVVALPLALAFGIQSGMGAEAGLYGAIILGFLASIFGGTNTQVSGPTGPITVLTASIVAVNVTKFGNLSEAMPFILLIFCLAGLFQILFGVLRVGKYIRFIPYPVISGFMTGIGLIIILLQLYPAVGLASPTSIFGIFEQSVHAIFNINWVAMFTTLATIGLIYLSPRITTLLPGSLIALVIMSVLCYYLHLDMPRIGNIPEGIPTLQVALFTEFKLSYLPQAVFPALTIAVLGSIDSLLTSIIADTKTKTFHKSNKELFGQGIGNMVVPLFGGLPGAGATMRTVVNINNGGKTKLSGVIHSITLAMVLLGMGGFASHIPLPVLAGILITVGISIIDYKGLRHIKNIPKNDSFVIILVIILTVFIGLIEAVVIGFIVASVLLMKHVSELTTSKSYVFGAHEVDLLSSWAGERQIPEILQKRIYIKHLGGLFFFAVTRHFRSLVSTIPDIKIVIMRMTEVPYIDQSALYALEEAYDFLSSRGIEVYLTGLNEQPKELLHSLHFIPDIVPETHIFDDYHQLIQYLFEKTKLHLESGGETER